MEIDLKELTSCVVWPGGDMIELKFVDTFGMPGTLRVPFDRAQSIAMTLPRLLTEALRRLTGHPEMRYVYPLGGWRLETAGEQPCLILTLVIEDGFEVSFGIPAAACQDIASALHRRAQSASRAAHCPPRDPVQLN